MQIGEKIKNIRTSKCMTQKQLAGEHITRNMLSRIENGAAMPSLPTVIYIAQKLNVPVGYLLVDGDDERLYRKMYNIDNIKRAFIDGDYRICRDICLSTGCYNDDEINMILTCCSAGIAKDEFNKGRLKSACHFFEEAADYSDRTIYDTDKVIAESSIYFRYMRGISQTLGGELIAEQVNEELAGGDVFCVYISVLEAIEDNSTGYADKVTAFAGRGDEASEALYAHIKARRAIQKGSYADAVKILTRVLNSQNPMADPVLYSVFCDLEKCSKEINDYKGAYEYSADRVNLLERMLSESEV